MPKNGKKNKTPLKYSISGIVQAWDGNASIELIPDQERTITIGDEKYAVFCDKDMDQAKLFHYKSFLNMPIASLQKLSLPMMVGQHIVISIASRSGNTLNEIKCDEPIMPSKTNIIFVK